MEGRLTTMSAIPPEPLAVHSLLTASDLDEIDEADELVEEIRQAEFEGKGARP
jgi:hypothetical protein